MKARIIDGAMINPSTIDNLSVNVPWIAIEDEKFSKGSKTITIAKTNAVEGINVTTQNLSPNFSSKYFEKKSTLFMNITFYIDAPTAQRFALPACGRAWIRSEM